MVKSYDSDWYSLDQCIRVYFMRSGAPLRITKPTIDQASVMFTCDGLTWAMKFSASGFKSLLDLLNYVLGLHKGCPTCRRVYGRFSGGFLEVP